MTRAFPNTCYLQLYIGDNLVKLTHHVCDKFVTHLIALIKDSAAVFNTFPCNYR